MKKLLIILLIGVLRLNSYAQDSIKFIPVFYKQCNNKLVKTDKVNFYLAYNEYHDVDHSKVTQPYVAAYHAAVKMRKTYDKVPEYINLPATVTTIDINANEFFTLDVTPDSNGIWRDTFYLENEERYYNPPRDIYTECGEVSDGKIIRYNLLGDVRQMLEYDSGILLSEVTFNDEGDTTSIRLNVTNYDSNYLVKKYNSEGTLTYYQDYKYTRLYNRDGVLIVELYHPLLTKRQIKKYKKKVSRRDFNKIQLKGEEAKVISSKLQPCVAKVYYPDGKIKQEAEYLVSMSILCSPTNSFAEMLAYDDEKWWFNIITLWRKLYNEQGGFIMEE